MPVYLFKTPKGERLVAAPSKKVAFDHIVNPMITCETASSNLIAETLKRDVQMEFVEVQDEEDAQTDLEKVAA